MKSSLFLVGAFGDWVGVFASGGWAENFVKFSPRPPFKLFIYDVFLFLRLPHGLWFLIFRNVSS